MAWAFLLAQKGNRLLVTLDPLNNFPMHFFHLMWGVGLFFNPTNPFAKLRAPVSKTVRSLQKRNPKQKLPRSGFWLGCFC